MADECSVCQQQVDDYAVKLEGRGRVAILWQKLRGRLGWNAEQEYQTAQIALKEAQQRQQALERAQAQQQGRERVEAAHRAKMAALEAEPMQEPARTQANIKPQFEQAAESRPPPVSDKQAEIDRHAERFRDAMNKKNDRDREID